MKCIRRYIHTYIDSYDQVSCSKQNFWVYLAQRNLIITKIFKSVGVMTFINNIMGTSQKNYYYEHKAMHANLILA